MGTLIIRHKVKDYSKWRPGFDRHARAQKSAGLTNPRVLRLRSAGSSAPRKRETPPTELLEE